VRHPLGGGGMGRRPHRPRRCRRERSPALPRRRRRHDVLAALKRGTSMDPRITHDAPRSGSPVAEFWGSDAMAEMLRALDLPYIALTPGASYRGLHDSLVNYLGNVRPQMLLCLHEDTAVSLAHGYAKVTGAMLGAALHSNVGLLHAAMSIFNAWCDR